MSTAKLLFKKCLRDIIHNLKQFIAIIFIVTVAVTLFIGLQANSKEFSNRVGEVFKRGNISDIWVTYNLDFEKLSQVEVDYNKIVEINGGDSALVEKRLFAPAKIDTFSIYTIMSENFPTINKPFDYETSESFNENDNFFFIDYDLVERYEIMTGVTLKLGDAINFSLNIQDYSAGIIQAVKNYENEFYTNIVPTLNGNLKNLFEDNKELISSKIDEICNEFAEKSSNFSLKLQINGIMRHPENIQTSTFNDSSVLLSSKLFFNKLIEYFKSQIQNYLETNLPNVNESVVNEVIKYITENENINNLFKSLLSSLNNQFVIKLGKDKTLSEVENQIENYYEDQTNESLTLFALTDVNNMPSILVVQSDITQSKQLAYCFPLIFFAVGILVVLTTISQLILKQRIEIGTYKSLGISVKTIFVYYMSMMTITTLFGVLLGLIIGPLLLPNVMNIKYNILYSLVPLKYSFPYISALCVIIGVAAVTILLTFILIRSELKLTPANSMRPRIPKINLKEKSNKPKNISLMMAIRNIRVHFVKSIMVIVGVMGCTGLLICGMGIDDVLNYGKDVDMNGILGSDVQVVYNENVTMDTVIDVSIFKDNNGNEIIDKYENFTMFSEDINKVGETYSEKVNMYAFDENATNFGYEKWEDNLNVCAIDKETAKKFKLKVGNHIEFKHYDDYGNLKEANFEVVKIFYTFTMKGVFFYYSSAPGLVTSYTNAWVTLKDGVSYEVAKELLTPATNPDNPYTFIASAMTYDENLARVDGYMSSVRSMTGTIKIFAVILAVIVLINLSILNFRERLRDLATLKVLGFSTFEISKSLIYETMILTIIGAILGLGIGFPLEILVLLTNQTPIIAYHYTISLATFGISLLISLITALAVNILMSFSIKKISMSESLKSIE